MQLQEWYDENKFPEDYIFAKAAFRQLHWVRTKLSSMIFESLSASDDDYANFISNLTVDSTHISKSIKLPVNFNNIKIKVRGNFYNWCCKCWISPTEDFPKYISNSFIDGYFEGMQDDDAPISFCVNSREELYATIWWMINTYFYSGIIIIMSIR